ncbi:MAG: nucleotidyltransferase domain-containing protein [Nanoarchaeota archaeon]
MVNIRITNIKIGPKEKLLKYLIENKNPVSIRQASGAIIVDYKNTHELVNKLQLDGVITKGKLGNTNPISINLAPNIEIYNVEKKRTEEFILKNPKLKVVKSYIEEVNYPFFIVLVFGSYVNGTNTTGSDIDVCVIVDNEDKSKELRQKLRLLPLKLEIHEFTIKEFISMIEKRQNNVGQEIVKNNIILYGVENYYNLIAKWMKRE